MLRGITRIRSRENGIQIRMSRHGNPYDNAKCEPFLKTLMAIPWRVALPHSPPPPHQAGRILQQRKMAVQQYNRNGSER
jgi:transposase InsO family protein